MDVAELRLVEEAELDEGGRDGGAVAAAQVFDAPAQQGGELGAGGELLVELVQEAAKGRTFSGWAWSARVEAWARSLTRSFHSS